LLLLIGGTGFLGTALIENLLADEQPLRLLTRGAGDWKVSNLSKYRRRGIEVVVGSLEDDAVLERALDGVSCVINLAGSYRPGPAKVASSTYEYLNLLFVEKLLHYAQELGIQRLIHVSCLGSREESESIFLRTKAEGDNLVKASQFYWTIIRPSFLFGDVFPLADLVKPILLFKPCLPIIGSGLNVVEPVHVSDCAKSISKSIYMRETVGRVFDIGGPESFTFAELLGLLREELGLSMNTMTIPSQFSGKAFELATRVLPKNSVSLELAQILIADSVADPASCAEAKELFGLSDISIVDHLYEIARSLEAK
jgi:NADH dehydrogenase